MCIALLWLVLSIPSARAVAISIPSALDLKDLKSLAENFIFPRLWVEFAT